jgi:hypothetical protein
MYPACLIGSRAVAGWEYSRTFGLRAKSLRNSPLKRGLSAASRPATSVTQSIIFGLIGTDQF